MTDIIDRLKDNRTVDGSAIMCELPEVVIDDAITEIERLRSLLSSSMAMLDKVLDNWKDSNDKMTKVLHD